MLFKAVFSILLVRVLKPSDYGGFSYLIYLVSLVSIFSDFGISQGTAYHLFSQSVNSYKLILKAIKILLIGILIVSIILWIINSLFDNKVYAISILLVSLLILTQLFFKFYTKLFESLNLNRIFWRINAFLGSFPWLFAYLMTYINTEIGFIISGYIFGYLILIIVITIKAIPIIRSLKTSESEEDIPLKRLFYKSFPFVLSSTSFYIFSQSAVILFKYFLNDEVVGYYSSALKLVELLSIVPSAISSSIVISFLKTKSKDKIFEIYSRLMAIIFVPILIIIILFNQELITLLYSSKYLMSGILLICLLPFFFAKIFGVLLSLSLDYSGLYIQRLKAVSLFALINLALNLIFIPTLGIYAAMFIMNVTYISLVLWYVWYFDKKIYRIKLRIFNKGNLFLYIMWFLFLLCSYIIKYTIINFWIVALLLLSVIYVIFLYKKNYFTSLYIS